MAMKGLLISASAKPAELKVLLVFTMNNRESLILHSLHTMFSEICRRISRIYGWKLYECSDDIDHASGRLGSLFRKIFCKYCLRLFEVVETY